MQTLGKDRAARPAVPFLERLWRDFAVHQQLSELASLRFALDRHWSFQSGRQCWAPTPRAARPGRLCPARTTRLRLYHCTSQLRADPQVQVAYLTLPNAETGRRVHAPHRSTVPMRSDEAVGRRVTTLTPGRPTLVLQLPNDLWVYRPGNTATARETSDPATSRGRLLARVLRRRVRGRAIAR